MANEVYTHIYNDTVFFEGNAGGPQKILVIKKPYRYAMKVLKAKIICQEAATAVGGEQIIFSNGEVASEVAVTFNPGETRKIDQTINLSIPLVNNISYVYIYTKNVETLAGIRIEYTFNITDIGQLSAELSEQSKDFSSMQFEGAPPLEGYDLCVREYSEYTGGMQVIRAGFVVAENVSSDTIYELRNAVDGGGLGFQATISAGTREVTLSGMALDVSSSQSLVFRFVSGDPTAANPRVNYVYIVPEYTYETYDIGNPPRFLTHSVEGVALGSVVESISLGTALTLKMASVNTRYNVNSTATILVASLLTGNSVAVTLSNASDGYTVQGFYIAAADTIVISVIDYDEEPISYNVGLEFVPYIAPITDTCATTCCPTTADSCDCVQFLVLRGEFPWEEGTATGTVTFRQLSDGSGYSVTVDKEDVL